jgi:hypothetical protein
MNSCIGEKEIANKLRRVRATDIKNTKIKIKKILLRGRHRVF